MARGKKINASTLDSATNRGKQWTGVELEFVMRDDLTAREVALMLGRTYAAVAAARHRCRHDPKWARLLLGNVDV